MKSKTLSELFCIFGSIFLMSAVFLGWVFHTIDFDVVDKQNDLTFVLALEQEIEIAHETQIQKKRAARLQLVTK